VNHRALVLFALLLGCTARQPERENVTERAATAAKPDASADAFVVPPLEGSGACIQLSHPYAADRPRPKGQVTSEPAKIVPPVDPRLIERQLRTRLPAFKACYERGLRRDPRLRGRLVLHFTVAPIGLVTAVSVDHDTLGDQETVSCVKLLLSRSRFPALVESVDVVFPVVFSRP
jgi:hypothetical protein